MKLRNIVLIALSFLGTSLLNAAVGSIVECEVTGKQLLFKAKAKNCDKDSQEKACRKYSTEPKLGPSKPVGCTPINTVAELEKAAADAINSRLNPKKKGMEIPVAPGGPQQLPVIGECKLKKPTAELSSIILPVETCDAKNIQEGCNTFKDVPFIGPSTAVPGTCKKVASMDELSQILTKEYENGRFPGFGGTVVKCKTRGEKKVYGEKASTCEKAEKELVCETAAGIADPIGCTAYPTDKQLDEALGKLPKEYGLECVLDVGGMSYRVMVPDCSKAVQNKECKPKDGKVESCQAIPPAELSKWTKAVTNDAMVLCQVKNMPAIIYPTYGRDCSPASQARACGEFNRPIRCDMMGFTQQQEEKLK